jgi:hypothetical protein
MVRNGLKRLKIRLMITDETQDELLRALLGDARRLILAYTRRTDAQWLESFDAIQTAVAAAAYARLGAEGLASRTEGAITTTFFGADDLPKSVTAPLNNYRLALTPL